MTAREGFGGTELHRRRITRRPAATASNAPTNRVDGMSLEMPTREAAGLDTAEAHAAFSWLQYMRHLVSIGAEYVHLCRTFEMHANALTKVENKNAFRAFRALAMNLK